MKIGETITFVENVFESVSNVTFRIVSFYVSERNILRIKFRCIYNINKLESSLSDVLNKNCNCYISENSDNEIDRQRHSMNYNLDIKLD